MKSESTVKICERYTDGLKITKVSHSPLMSRLRLENDVYCIEFGLIGIGTDSEQIMVNVMPKRLSVVNMKIPVSKNDDGTYTINKSDIIILNNAYGNVDILCEMLESPLWATYCIETLCDNLDMYVDILHGKSVEGV